MGLSMKPLIRLFFRTVRLLLTPLVLLVDRLTTPRGIARSPEQQAQVSEAVTNLALYHYPSCPFCIKTRREMKRLSLPIELRDAQHEATWREELLREGGSLQVPCLRITEANGAVRWLYESVDIIAYLRERFAPVSAVQG